VAEVLELGELLVVGLWRLLAHGRRGIVRTGLARARNGD